VGGGGRVWDASITTLFIYNTFLKSDEKWSWSNSDLQLTTAGQPFTHSSPAASISESTTNYNYGLPATTSFSSIFNSNDSHTSFVNNTTMDNNIPNSFVNSIPLNRNFTTQNPFPERLTHSYQLQVTSAAAPGKDELNILKGQSNTARSVQCALLKN
jgi:hypothetical protein